MQHIMQYRIDLATNIMINFMNIVLAQPSFACSHYNINLLFYRKINLYDNNSQPRCLRWSTKSMEYVHRRTAHQINRLEDSDR